MFKKVLVANRGEIAIRVIRACRELGIKTVAIYSEVDEDSLHINYADEAICVGPSSSTASYLNIANILSAAEVLGCDAVHPGYGFLAESEKFADMCEECGIKFIGPSKEAISKMGNKNIARKTMKDVGVPVVPGSDGIIEDADTAVIEAKKLGFPLLIKASAGGGGKGMRLVYSEDKVKESFELARNEALKAFGNADVYIEKFIFPVRHIEVQVLGDSKGHVVCFPERDCSLQRRNQKLVEESPSPFIKSKIRKKLLKSAYKAATAVKYESAGTIEFVMDNEGNYYFLEMNTRIQVEHTVTEVLTGVDLVKEQIKIAYGEEIDIDDSDFYNPKIAALEFRVNAEDYKRDFLPQPGKIEMCIFPGGPGVRVDSHIYTGYTVPGNYDSLLGKIIIHDKNRKDLLKRFERVLNEIVIEGIPTTIDFYKELIKHPLFIEGNITTDSLSKIIEEIKKD